MTRPLLLTLFVFVGAQVFAQQQMTEQSPSAQQSQMPAKPAVKKHLLLLGATRTATRSAIAYSPFDCETWIAIPSELIARSRALPFPAMQCEGARYAVVELTLQKPKADASSALHSLLALYATQKGPRLLARRRSPSLGLTFVPPMLVAGVDGDSCFERCRDEYLDCQVGCYQEHPDDTSGKDVELRDDCLASCDAAFSLCQSFACGAGR